MIIRRYQPSDRPRLLEITAEVFGPVAIVGLIEQQFGLRNGVPWQECKQAEVAAEIAAHPPGTFVAEVEGEPVGYVTTELDRQTLTGHVHNVAVAADHQGKGVAKAILDAALDYFQAEGMIYSQIETLTCNERGQAFYPRLGYREVGRKIYYFMRIADRRRI